MKGKIDGMAYRVPTASVSVTDLTFSLEKDTDVDGLNNELKNPILLNYLKLIYNTAKNFYESKLKV